MNQESLSLNVLNMKLQSPIIVASGPTSDSLSKIRKWYEAGAGAIITKTICSEKQISKETKGNRKILQIPPVGDLNASTYSKKSICEWQNIIKEMVDEGANIIPNIFERNNEKLASTARAIGQTGCKAIELGISCPNDDNKAQVGKQLIKEYINTVKKEVGNKIKIIVKLSADQDYLNNIKTAIDAGADAISISDTLKGLKVDIENKKIFANGPAGYSGPGIKPIVLHSIYQIRKAGINCPILGIGGIQNAEDVIEYMYLGVDAVQICTTLMYGKEKRLKEINQELTNWTKEENVPLSQIEHLV